MDKNKTKLFAMSNVTDLGKKIAKELKIELETINKTKFADGEIIVSANSTVRNKHTYVIASPSKPVHDNLMELLLFIDSLKRASAKTITVVLTYYAYARQDRKASGRQPIGAKLIADVLEKAGATKVIVVDLHNPSIQGFFNIPVDDLKGQYILAQSIREESKKFTIASPDHGGAVRARLLAELIADTVDIAIVDKRRTGPNQTETLGVLGKVKDKNIALIDDMIDTGGTIIKAAQALKEAGAKKIIVAATHGLFNNGFEMFEKEPTIDKVIVTDSIPTVKDIKAKKLKIVSLDWFIAQTIKATIESSSVSIIYENIKKKMD